MVEAHRGFAYAVLAVTAAAVVAGAISYRRGRAGVAVSHLLALAQTVIIAQVALGLLLLSDDHHAREDLHYLYGALALVAIVAPWLYAPRDPRLRLVWFVGATLVAGALAVRAYLSAS